MKTIIGGIALIWCFSAATGMFLRCPVVPGTSEPENPFLSTMIGPAIEQPNVAGQKECDQLAHWKQTKCYNECSNQHTCQYLADKRNGIKKNCLRNCDPAVMCECETGWYACGGQCVLAKDCPRNPAKDCGKWFRAGQGSFSHPLVFLLRYHNGGLSNRLNVQRSCFNNRISLSF